MVTNLAARVRKELPIYQTAQQTSLAHSHACACLCYPQGHGWLVPCATWHTSKHAVLPTSPSTGMHNRDQARRRDTTVRQSSPSRAPPHGTWKSRTTCSESSAFLAVSRRRDVNAWAVYAGCPFGQRSWRVRIIAGRVGPLVVWGSRSFFLDERPDSREFGGVAFVIGYRRKRFQRMPVSPACQENDISLFPGQVHHYAQEMAAWSVPSYCVADLHRFVLSCCPGYGSPRHLASSWKNRRLQRDLVQLPQSGQSRLDVAGGLLLLSEG
jgi:hypothetical protein